MNNRWLFEFLNAVGVASLLRTGKKNKLTVLSLHRISPQSDYFWNPITPHSFELLLQQLQKHYNLISFADIETIDKPVLNGKPFLILSFDDGYYDFYEHALPLLVKYKLPCNHNIVNACAEHNHIIWTQRLNTIFTHCRDHAIQLSFESKEEVLNLARFGKSWMKFYLYTYKWMLGMDAASRFPLIDQKEKQLSVSATVRMMNWDQVIECADNKVEIGCHTYSHDVLSTITDPAILKHEIVFSANEMKSRLNRDVNVLALPNGESNNDINRYAAGAGLNYILHVQDNINKWDAVKGSGIKDIYRINMVEEPIASMVLRSELLHAKLKQYV